MLSFNPVKNEISLTIKSQVFKQKIESVQTQTLQKFISQISQILKNFESVSLQVLFNLVSKEVKNVSSANQFIYFYLDCLRQFYQKSWNEILLILTENEITKFEKNFTQIYFLKQNLAQTLQEIIKNSNQNMPLKLILQNQLSVGDLITLSQQNLDFENLFLDFVNFKKISSTWLGNVSLNFGKDSNFWEIIEISRTIPTQKKLALAVQTKRKTDLFLAQKLGEFIPKIEFSYISST